MSARNVYCPSNRSKTMFRDSTLYTSYGSGMSKNPRIFGDYNGSRIADVFRSLGLGDFIRSEDEILKRKRRIERNRKRQQLRLKKIIQSKHNIQHSLNQQISVLKNKNNTLLDTIKLKDTEIVTLKDINYIQSQDLDKFVEDLKIKDNQIAALKESNANLNPGLQEKEKLIMESQQKVKNLKKKYKKLFANYNKLKATNKSQTDELFELRKRFQEEEYKLKKSNKDLISKLNQFEKTRLESIKVVQEKMEKNLNQQKMEHQKELQKVVQEHDKLSNKMDQLKKELLDYTELHKKSQQDLNLSNQALNLLKEEQRDQWLITRSVIDEIVQAKCWKCGLVFKPNLDSTTFICVECHNESSRMSFECCDLKICFECLWKYADDTLIDMDNVYEGIKAMVIKQRKFCCKNLSKKEYWSLDEQKTGVSGYVEILPNNNNNNNNRNSNRKKRYKKYKKYKKYKTYNNKFYS